MKTKKQFTSLVLSGALVANLLVAGVAMAANDTVDNQALVNEGALAVTYTPTTQFLGSFASGPSVINSVLEYTFSSLEFQNTTGTNAAFALSWTTQNLQATTGFAAASTGFNYTSQLAGTGDSDGVITFDAGSVGTGNVALSAPGTSDNFGGSGASGSTSDSTDLLTGSGAAFNLVGQIIPQMSATYNNQIAGLYTGTVTFTII